MSKFSRSPIKALKWAKQQEGLEKLKKIHEEKLKKEKEKIDQDQWLKDNIDRLQQEERDRLRKIYKKEVLDLQKKLKNEEKYSRRVFLVKSICERFNFKYVGFPTNSQIEFIVKLAQKRKKWNMNIEKKHQKDAEYFAKIGLGYIDDDQFRTYYAYKKCEENA